MIGIYECPYQWDGKKFTDWHLRADHGINSLISTESLWRITGYYVAKGMYDEKGRVWFRFDVFGGREMNNLIERLDGLFFFLIDATTYEGVKLILTEERANSFFHAFGKTAKDKRVPPEIFELPVELLRAFLEGYTLGAGDYIYTDTEDIMRLAPLNPGLSDDMQKIFQKVYGNSMELKAIGITWVLCGVMREYERK